MPSREMLQAGIYVIKDGTNLNAVTIDTDGDSIETQWYKTKSVFVTVTGNTGAVTVKIQASHDGTNWFDLTSKTYSTSNETDIFSYASFFPFMRSITETQSNSTVSTVFTGRS